MAVAGRSKRTKSSVRMQVVLPSKLAAQVRARIPVRERSAFIAGAVANAIDRAEQMERQQVEPEGQIWRDQDYPYLNTPDDIQDWREAIWSGRDPHDVLRRKYAKQGVVTKHEFRTWLKVWRDTNDPIKAFDVVRATKRAKRPAAGRRRA